MEFVEFKGKKYYTYENRLSISNNNLTKITEIKGFPREESIFLL